MKKLSLMLLLLVVGLTACGPNLSTPEGAGEAFMQSFQAQDIEKCLELMHNSDSDDKLGLELNFNHRLDKVKGIKEFKYNSKENARQRMRVFFDVVYGDGSKGKIEIAVIQPQGEDDWVVRYYDFR